MLSGVQSVAHWRNVCGTNQHPHTYRKPKSNAKCSSRVLKTFRFSFFLLPLLLLLFLFAVFLFLFTLCRWRLSACRTTAVTRCLLLCATLVLLCVSHQVYNVLLCLYTEWIWCVCGSKIQISFRPYFFSFAFPFRLLFFSLSFLSCQLKEQIRYVGTTYNKKKWKSHKRKWFVETK